MRKLLGVVIGAGFLWHAGVVSVFGGPRDFFGDTWNWSLPPNQFSKLSQTERAQYSKAEELLDQGNYETAAIEFEKFIAQNPQTPINAHCLLLKGYSLQLAKQRNQAIEVYTEITDLYGETSVDAAVPAIYLMGKAMADNGNLDQAIRTWKNLLDKDQYHRHPLVDLGLFELADLYINAKKEKQAEACWTKILELNMADTWRRGNSQTLIRVRNTLADFYIRQQRYGSLEILFNIPGPGPAYTNALYFFGRGIAIYGQLDKDGKASFYKWFCGRRTLFADAGRLDEYTFRVMDLALGLTEKKDWTSAFQTCIKEVRLQPIAYRKEGYGALISRSAHAVRTGWTVEDAWQAILAGVIDDYKDQPSDRQMAAYGAWLDHFKFNLDSKSKAGELLDVIVVRMIDLCKAMIGSERDTNLSPLVGRMCALGQYERSMLIADAIGDQPLRTWKKIEVFQAMSKFAEAAKLCEELEKMPNEQLAKTALETRARLYKDRLNRHADAIKLFNEINRPPWTAWMVVECYEALNKAAEAVGILDEIENFFVQDAPRAALHKATVWNKAGDQKKAIAAARAVIKKYPKSQPSSQAHQMLERWGVKTGGGVVEGQLN